MTSYSIIAEDKWLARMKVHWTWGIYALGGTWKCLYNLNVLMSQSTGLQRHLQRFWGGGKHVRGELIDAKFQRKGRGGPTHCRGHMGWSRLEGCAVIKVLLPPQSLVHESDYCLYLGDCTSFTSSLRSREDGELLALLGAAQIARPSVGILHTFASKYFSMLEL